MLPYMASWLTSASQAGEVEICPGEPMFFPIWFIALPGQAKGDKYKIAQASQHLSLYGLLAYLGKAKGAKYKFAWVGQHFFLYVLLAYLGKPRVLSRNLPGWANILSYMFYWLAWASQGR